MKMQPAQLELITKQFQTLKDRSPFYAKKFDGIDIAAITTQEEFERLPFSEKADLREAYPLGIQAVPDEEVVRIHSSSGTTGTPVIIPYTKQDVDDWAEMFARCYRTAGITAKDRIQITPGYGLWTAGIGFQLGCERLGAMAIPMGPGNTEKQLKMMQDLGSTVITATSSYALLLAEEITKRGLRDKLYLTRGVIGSERWGEKMRQRIQNELGIEIFDIYGLTEIYGPGIGISCREHDGMHIWSDYVYCEIVDAKTGKVTGAAKVAGATDKAFTAPTDAVSTGDTYFCVVEFYNSKLDRETAYAKSEGVTVKVNAAPEATMDIQVSYKLADGTVVATELRAEQKADSGKSYVTVKAKDLITDEWGLNKTLVSAKTIRVPFAADTLANVEFIVK